MLDAAEIVLRTKSIFESLKASPIWSPSLSSGAIDATPIFVTSLQPAIMIGGATHLPTPNYAIAEVRQAHGITARFALNSETGEFLEAEAIKKAGTQLSRFIAEATAASLLPGPLPKPTIVWRPCRESSNLFLPFWSYVYPTGTKYVRGDGKVYDALTTAVAG